MEEKQTEPVKICAKCGIEKSLTEFHKRKNGRYGVKNICKTCCHIYRVVIYKTNPEKAKAEVRAWREANPEKKKALTKAWYNANREKVNAKSKLWRKNNRERAKELTETWNKANPVKKRAYYKKYYIDKRNDYNFKVNRAVKCSIYRALRNDKNGNHWESLVGYTLDDLKNHLEKQFVGGMTWENYGKTGWTIDHKIPVSVFNFTNSEHRDFKRCWSLKNLQPMWGIENYSKGAKLTKHFQPSLLM